MPLPLAADITFEVVLPFFIGILPFDVMAPPLEGICIRDDAGRFGLLFIVLSFIGFIKLLPKGRL